MNALMRTALFLAFALAASCGGSHHDAAAPASSAPASSTAPASGVVPPGQAKVGDKTTCPVSGEEFTVTESSPKVEYEGKTYYFCCPGCDKKFQSNPQKYLKPAS